MDTILTTPGLTFRANAHMRAEISQGKRIPNEGLAAGVEDVAKRARDEKILKTKEKFSDIVDVNNLEGEITGYSDDVNVAGRLSKPEHVLHFEKLGAPKFVIDTSIININVVYYNFYKTI